MKLTRKFNFGAAGLLGLLAAGLVLLPDTAAATPFAFELAPVFQMLEARAGSINITVRDSVTGKRVAGELRSVASDGTVSRAVGDASGKGTVAARGRTDIEVSAAGYFPIKSYFGVDGNSLDVTVYLDPIEIPNAMRSDVIAAATPKGKTLIHGNIFDANGAAIADALVSFVGSDASARTDSDGHFRLLVETPPVDPVGDLPDSAELIVQKQGKVIYRRSNTMIPEGDVHLIIDVKDGETDVDGTHKLRLPAEELKNAQNYEPPTFDEVTAPDQPTLVAVPASIRVGSTCPSGRTSCTVFTVYTLDAYVRFGLDDEWIASWNANSLKAGAVAFRSYGAYHVNHPISAANYDICNTTSCQVCDPSDSATSTNNATNQTSGSVVVNSTSTDILFAEYSAENNLGGCPDGFTGNNGTWPCLTDTVDAGQTFNGHGRGMCQWGSQRWSINQGKDFVWIVEHYYNGNGNPSGLRNGIFQMSPDTIPPPPNLTEPGNQTAPGTVVSTLTPTFQWESMSGADGYALYVSKFNGSTYDLVYNSETALPQPITGTSFTLPAGILVADAQYRWNMAAHIAAGYGTANTFRNYFAVNLNSAATVSGRVTTPTGLPLRNAQVVITDPQGIRRTATTSSFGIYSFSAVNVGQTHSVSISNKRYRFAPQVIQVNGNLSNVDFVGLE
ncbi:MAG: carboxypeptidase regulatory-like domain-containing protein [Pyrinomonadaceae bacterium]